MKFVQLTHLDTNGLTLQKENNDYILEQSLIAERKLNQFIDEVKKKYGLENDKICLLGFSQGCMMSLNLGLTAKQKYSCIVGFSGKIINQENLRSRLNALTKTLLIHGDLDQVVAPILC